MANVKKYYKSDFDLMLDFGISDFTGLSVPGGGSLRMEFYTTDISRAHVASFQIDSSGQPQSVNIINPSAALKSFRIGFHSHGLQPGPLRLRRVWSYPEGNSTHRTIDYLTTGVILSSGLETTLAAMGAPAPIDRTASTPLIVMEVGDDSDPDWQANVSLPVPSKGSMEIAYSYGYGEAVAVLWGEFDIDAVSDSQTEE